MIANLFKVKIIRNFLSLYKEECWEKLICNMAEYGIILLKKRKNISSMSSDDIINFVEDFKRTEGIIPPINNVNNRRSSNSKNKIISNKKNLFNNSLNKSITSNYSSKSSKSVNKKRNNSSMKSKSKSKQKFLKRNESFSYNKNTKKNKKLSNKSFSGSENKNNYTRIKIDSNRELTTNNFNFKNENFGGQVLKDSFNSISSKDTFFTNKKINNNNSHNYTNKKSNNKSNKFNDDKLNIKKNNNDFNNNSQIKNKKTNKKKKKEGAKTKTIKIESKIKDLIMKDKNNFINSGGNNNFNDINNNQVFALPMNAIDELGSLRSNNDIPTKTSNDSLRINITKNNNNIINDTNNNNMNDFNDINNTNKINMNNNISTITSLEDKLNGLTLKLSKLNESINNNKKKLSAY